MLTEKEQRLLKINFQKEWRKKDFIIRLGNKLRQHRKMVIVSYGAILQYVLDEFELTYFQAIAANPYELKRKYSAALKKEG
jgi:hypothetical protein